jgi:hypothetical protein
MPSDEEELDRQVAAMRAAITPEQRMAEQFERECRRAFIQAYTALDKQVAAATGDRMRVFMTAGKDWEARSHIFPMSKNVNGTVGFVFSVGKPQEVGELFQRSFAVTPSNHEKSGIENATRAEAFAFAESIAVNVVSEVERNGISLRRWTDIRNDVLQGAQALFNSREDRRRRLRLFAGAGIAVLAVAAILYALAQIAGR